MKFRDLQSILNKQAKIIRAEEMTNSFEEELWDSIKIYKNDYVPQHTKLRNLEGQLVNDKQRPYTRRTILNRYSGRMNGRSQSCRASRLRTPFLMNRCLWIWRKYPRRKFEKSLRA